MPCPPWLRPPPSAPLRLLLSPVKRDRYTLVHLVLHTPSAPCLPIVYVSLGVSPGFRLSPRTLLSFFLSREPTIRSADVSSLFSNRFRENRPRSSRRHCNYRASQCCNHAITSRAGARLSCEFISFSMNISKRIPSTSPPPLPSSAPVHRGFTCALSRIEIGQKLTGAV